MANPEHLEILRQGVEVWNAWRKQKKERGSLDLASYVIKLLNEDVTPDLSEVDLSGMNLSDADLSEAILRNSNLSGVNLHAASLVGADLSGACLRGAQLGFADLALAVLNNANLVGASFFRTALHETVLTNSDFLNVQMALTIISNVDLRGIRNLESVIHGAPSTIGIDTIHKSRGNIPEVFLRGCGVPEYFIKQIQGLVALEPIQFYSCFISYSHKDEEFANRLYSRMRDANLRVWYAPEDMKGGEKLPDQIFSAIQLYDKLLLVLSENSLKSEWVVTEIRRARKAEREEKRRKLLPIRLVDYEAIRDWECFDVDSGKDLAVELREYFIPDFSNWKDNNSFERAFDRLLRDLKAQERAESRDASAKDKATQLSVEFEEIKANIIFSTLAPVIAAELKRLKTFLHMHSSLLSRSDMSDFYQAWIAPFEIHLEYGASLDLKQAQYEQMKEQLAQINL